MDTNRDAVLDKRVASRSLPNVLLAFKEQSRTCRSSSFITSSKPCSSKSPPYISRPKTNISSDAKTEESSPTIGELLGDDQLFHDRYHHQYSAPKFSRKRPHYPSHPRSSHVDADTRRAKHLRASYSDRSKGSSHPCVSASNVIESTMNSAQFYPYSTAYNYPSFCAYGCYCYSNAASCCPCLGSDCYTRLFYPEISYGSPPCDPSSSHSDYYFSGRNRSQSHAYQ